MKIGHRIDIYLERHHRTRVFQIYSLERNDDVLVRKSKILGDIIGIKSGGVDYVSGLKESALGGFYRVLAGETILAKDALEIGLVNKVVPVETFQEEAEAFISKIKASSPVVLKMAKKAILQGWDTGVAQGLKRIEDVYMKELMATEDAHEGLKAFMEERKAVWKGK